MRKLLSKQGRFGKCCCWLYKIISIWWVKYFILPLLQTLPPGLIIFSIDHKDDALAGKEADATNLVVNNPVLNGTVTYLADNPYVAFIIAATYLIGLNGLINLVQDKGDHEIEEIDSKGLLTLFESLEAIVGAKANRFGEYLKSYINGSKNAKEVFQAITKPDQQIALIAAGLHGFFDAIDTVDVNFRVCVISTKGGLATDFYYYHPISEPPRAEIKDLQSSESTVSVCLRKKSIVIVPDVHEVVEKGKNREYVGSTSGQDERSILCYPVMHHYTDDIPYVISVVADKKDYFRTEKKHFYNWVFRHFAVRMALEHSLLLLKKETN